jgi:hypothetical protein
MRLWRTIPLDRSVAADARGGPLWFPREQQGFGRHDNPDRYGCLYLAADPVSATSEAFARFRGDGRLTAPMFRRLGLPLAMAELEIPDNAVVIDLDDPKFLADRELRPSLVATHERELTQATAADLFHEYPDVLGLRWWSTIEATWMNWTVFDRAADVLELVDVVELRIDDAVVQEAAELLGMAP